LAFAIPALTARGLGAYPGGVVDRRAHLHVLARNGVNLTGDVRHLTPRDVKAAFDSTPYGSAPGLEVVVDGKVNGRGYQIAPDGWVAVTSCSGVSQQDCANELESVAVSGDIRAFHQRARVILHRPLDPASVPSKREGTRPPREARVSAIIAVSVAATGYLTVFALTSRRDPLTPWPDGTTNWLARRVTGLTARR
jgi:hypothetical protein